MSTAQIVLLAIALLALLLCLVIRDELRDTRAALDTLGGERGEPTATDFSGAEIVRMNATRYSADHYYRAPYERHPRRDAAPAGTPNEYDRAVERWITAERQPSRPWPRSTENYTQTPDSAACRVTGDLDVQAKIAAPAGTPNEYERAVERYYLMGMAARDALARADRRQGERRKNTLRPFLATDRRPT